MALDAITSPGAGTTGPGANAPQEMSDLWPFVLEASKETGIPAEVIGGMIWQESRGKAGTPGGGLMQIGQAEFDAMKAKHPNLIKGDINDPASNIMAGALYLKELGGADGDIGLALRKYNSGPNGADPNNLSAIPAGTGDPTYVDKVTEHAKKIDNGEPLPP